MDGIHDDFYWCKCANRDTLVRLASTDVHFRLVLAVLLDHRSCIVLLARRSMGEGCTRRERSTARLGITRRADSCCDWLISFICTSIQAVQLDAYWLAGMCMLARLGRLWPLCCASGKICCKNRLCSTTSFYFLMSIFMRIAL